MVWCVGCQRPLPEFGMAPPVTREVLSCERCYPLHLPPLLRKVTAKRCDGEPDPETHRSTT